MDPPRTPSLYLRSEGLFESSDQLVHTPGDDLDGLRVAENLGLQREQFSGSERLATSGGFKRRVDLLFGVERALQEFFDP